jgi:ribose transport system ATP-binding protein
VTELAERSASVGRPALSMRGIWKSFGDVSVLKGVDFEVRAGEIHALVGSNGAGKSTLLKILEGAYSQDEGVVEISGEQGSLENQGGGTRAVSMIFQEFSLIPTLTVAQNIFLTREPRGPLGLIRDKVAERETHSLFARLGLNIDVGRRMSTLPTATWQLTEIAKAIAQNAGVLVMDEPTSSLAKAEAVKLFALMRHLRDQGVAIIFVSHRLDEIFEVCDRITVLRDGKRVRTESISDISMAEVIDDMLGRKLEQMIEWVPRDGVGNSSRVVLSVSGLCAGPRVRDVDLQVKGGEIVGLAGLMGSGRSELVRAIFGIDRPDKGSIAVDEKPLSSFTPRGAMAAGIGLVPEDRRKEGLVLDHSVKENLLLPVLGSVSKAGIVDDRSGGQLAKSYMSKLSIKARSSAQRSALLSGGNQQKIVIAKWLATKPRVLLMDEPTAGVDVGTKSEIVRMVRDFADQGGAVIFISSELPELLAVSDRIIVLRDGSIYQEMQRSQVPDEEHLQRVIQGVK